MSKDIKRIVSTSFWEDPKVMTLFTPEDKYFMLYLLTNPHTTQLGIYQLVPKIAAFEMGYSVESVMSLLERFEGKYGVIRYSNETMEIAIKNYLRHSIVKGGKPVFDCLQNEAKKVKDKSLLWFITEHLEDKDILPTVKEFLEELKEESNKEENNNITINYIDNKDINNNDNDNERNVHVTQTLRGHDAEMAKKMGFADDEDLLSAYVDFFKMRKSIKKPLTDRAIVMLSNELQKLAPDDTPTKIAILNQSSFHCWQGVFPLKDGNDNSYHVSNDVSGGRQ